MDHRATAEYAARRLREMAPEDLEQVILYGSVARREAGPESDVDLLVVARRFRPVFDAVHAVRAELMRKDAPMLSVVILRTEEWARERTVRSGFSRSVEREGERLLVQG